MLASVLINNFNYAKYIESCVESVLNQTYDEIEVILYDDGSTDDSLQVARKFEDKIEIISSENYGKAPSQNQANAIYKAFLKSKGEIVFLLDSDDVFKPNKVATVVSCFQSPDIVMVQHQFDLIDSSDNVLDTTFKPLFPAEDIVKFIKFTSRLEFLFMQTSALAFRRDFLEEILPLAEDNHTLVWPDIRLSRSAVFYGKVKTLHESLALYRSHDSNDSSKLKNKSFFKKVQIQYYDWFNNQGFISKRIHPPHGKFSKIAFMVRLMLLMPLGKNWTAKKNFIKRLIFT